MSVFSVLLKKEVLDVVRDRRTLLLVLGLPMVMYPLLIVAMGAIVSKGAERLRNEPLTVATVGSEAPALLGRQPAPAKTTWRPLELEAAKAELQAEKLDAIVEVPEGALERMRAGAQAVVTVWYTKRLDRSNEAYEGRLRPLLESLNVELRKERLEEKQLAQDFAEPLKALPFDVDMKDSLGRRLAASLLPILLLTTLLTAAVQAAVDSTAGEKERGTFETLLVAPVRTTQVMFAKYVTVTVIAVATTLANLTATGLSFAGSGALGVDLPVHFSAGQLGLLVLCMVPTATLISGVALAVASTAQNVRQGSSVMVPLMLVGLLPALVAQMPGFSLSPTTALVPLLNTALLVKAVALGTVKPLDVILTVGSVMVTSAVAFRVAASTFDSEAFRFGGTGSSARVSWFKRAARRRTE